MLHLRSKFKGFTLLELMVVMVIIGIASSFVGLQFFRTAARDLGQDAAELIEAFKGAHDWARNCRCTLQWRADATGWQFWQLQSAGWQALIDPASGPTGGSNTIMKRRSWRVKDTAVVAMPALPVVVTPEWIEAPLQLTLHAETYQVVISRDARGHYAQH